LKIANFWFSKSVFNVKNLPNLFENDFLLRICD